MRIDEIKNTAEYLRNNKGKAGGIFLYLFINKKTKTNPIEIKQLILDRNLADKLFWQAISSLDQIVNSCEKDEISELVVFDPDSGSNDYNYFDVNSVPNYNEIEEIILNDETDTYSKDFPFKNKIRSWIIGIEYENEIGETKKEYFFQKFSKTKMLDRNKTFIFEHGDEFKELENHTLVINNYFDAIVIDDNLIAINFNNFKSIFDYKEFIMNKAIEFYDEIISSQKISDDISVVGFDNLENKIKESFSFSNKCFKIKQKQYYKKINNADLKELNAKYNFNLKINNGTWEIEESTDIKTVLSILNDEYNRSMLTGNEYLVGGKTELS